MSSLVIFVVLTLTASCVCDQLNFIGSSITFSPGDNNTVLFDYRLSWLCDKSGNNCLAPCQGNPFKPCPTYDNDTTHFPNMTCTDTGSYMLYKWASARGRQKYPTGQDQFLSRNLSAGEIRADLVARKDNGRINTPPTTDMIPIVMFEHGRKHKLKIPVGDVDGDLIKCRWSNVNLTDGCGDHCNGVIEATLDEDKCELEYFANKVGNYLVALQIEDFMSSKSTKPLSSVPLQFFVYVLNGDSDVEGSGDVSMYDVNLGDSLYFTSPTPEDEDCFEVEIHSDIKLEIMTNYKFLYDYDYYYYNSYTRYVRVNTIKPVGMASSNNFQGREGGASVNITWTPSDGDEDRFHILCFYAYTYKNTAQGELPVLTTETRCIRIVVKGPESSSKGLSGLTCNKTECLLPDEKTFNITYVDDQQQKYAFGDKVMYKCNKGYQFENSSRNKDYVYCKETGNFTEFHQCALVECKLPDLSQLNIEGGDVTRGKDVFYYGDAIVYECSHEYRFHDREKNKTVRCTETGKFEKFTKCVKECLLPDAKTLNITYVGDPQQKQAFGDTVMYKCNKGYRFENYSRNKDSVTCKETGNFTEFQQCGRVECKLPDLSQLNIEVGNVTRGKDVFRYGDNATYECSQGYRFHDREKTKHVRCTETGKFEQFTKCVTVPKCLKSTDNRGTIWNDTLADKRANQTCSKNYTGIISRKCDWDGKWKDPYYDCVRNEIKHITDTIDKITEKSTAAEIKNVTAQLTAATVIKKGTENVTETLTSGEVAVLSSSLGKIANALNSTSDTTAVTNANITDNFFQSCDNLLDSSNQESWVAQSAEKNTGAEKVLEAVDVLTEAIGRNLQNETKKTVIKKNLALEVKKVNITEEKVVFPDPESLGNTTEEWITQSKSSISLNSDALKDKTVKYVTTAVMYKDVSDILPSTALKTGNDTSKSEDKDQGAKEEKRINGPILAMSIIPSVGELDPPISITFQHFEEKLTQPACSFWNFEGNKTGWSTKGCNVASSSDASTVCECNHLTNFAVLMSPFKEVETASKALAVISILGITVSIFCLLLTLSIHAMFWKILRNERTVILMNLCGALVISNITFLAGINETDDPTSCAVVAAFLQYIYLVVFCVMLVEGVIIALTIVYVFKTKRNTKMLLIPAWVVPAFIVGISVLATQGEGYGNKNYCWLSIENGLIWTFVGPVMIILVCNVVCLTLVFRAMFKTTAMETKTALDKVKTSFRCLCVLLPLMGLSWILGIFYVDERSVFIQYIFTILNAFQGFFIFLFHCLLNQQVKKALELRVRRFSASHTALRSFSSTGGKDGSGTRSNSTKKDTGKSIEEGTSMALTETIPAASETAQSSKSGNDESGTKSDSTKKDTGKSVEEGTSMAIIEEKPATSETAQSSTSGNDGGGTKSDSTKTDTGKSIEEGISMAFIDEKAAPLETAQSSASGKDGSGTKSDSTKNDTDKSTEEGTSLALTEEKPEPSETTQISSTDKSICVSKIALANDKSSIQRNTKSSTSGKDGSGTTSDSTNKDTGKSIEEGTSIALTEEKTTPSEAAQTSV